MSKYQNINFRPIKSFDDDDDDDDDKDEVQNENNNKKEFCNHWGSALQVVCHILVPLRKALVHFYLNHKKKNPIPDDKVEWKLLFELGLLFQTMIAINPKPKKTNDNDDEEEEENEPVDPTTVYLAIQAIMDKKNKNKKESSSPSPKDATEAIQMLLEMIQSCTRTLPVTSQLWSALLDESGLGAIAKQTIIGKKKDDGSMLQRTIRETRILLCPFPLVGQYDTLDKGITNTMKQSLTTNEHDWELEENKANFEVRIPLWDKNDGKSEQDNTWNTIKTMQFDTLPNYWFVSIQRFKESEEDKKKEKKEDNDNDSDSDSDDDKSILNPLVDIPVDLDTGTFCAPGCKNRKFNLVGGILYDDDDYVAILKNPNVAADKSKSSSVDDKEDANEDEEEIEDWNLMETDEIIPMTQDDAIEFLKGGDEGGGGVCGTVLVYKTTNTTELKSSDQLLSDIIISHVSGKLDSKIDFYYEEEIIED